MSESKANPANENGDNQDKKEEDESKSKKFTVTKLEEADVENKNALGNVF